MSSRQINYNHPSESLLLADARIEVYPDTIIADGVPIDASPIELDIIKPLAQQPDIPMAYADLCRSVWGYATKQNYDTARVHIFRLRKKLGSELGDPNKGAIITKQALGYCAVQSLTSTEKLHSDEQILFIADNRIAVQPATLTVVKDGETMDSLSKTQLDILALLARHPDTPVESTGMMHSIWGEANRHVYDSARVQVAKLRQHLGPELGDKRLGAVRQQFNVGYYAVSSLEG